MGLLKDLTNYFSYRKIIKKNRIKLESDFNLRIDNADRLYTVINIPVDLIGEAYDLKKSDIDRISEGYIKEYLNKLSIYLNTLGLNEIYDFYDPIKKVDKYSYLVVLGYKQLDSVEINRIIYRIMLPLLIVISLIGIISFLF
jgi:hypothetical protein